MKTATGVGGGVAALLLAASAALGAVEPEQAVFVERAKLDDPYAFATLRFFTGSAELSPRSSRILEGLIGQIVAGEQPIEIVGHTSGLGKASVNQKLSEARVETVKAWLVSRGLPAERLRLDARGETEPVDSNDTVEGRRRNRRVELRYAQ